MPMFKRIEKANNQLEKRRKRGEVTEDDGPSELVMDMDSSSDSDSDSESESGSSSDSSSDADSSDEEKVKEVKQAKAAMSKKRAREEDSDAESDDADSDFESDSDDEEDDATISSAEGSTTSTSAKAGPSLTEAMHNPIYVKPNAIVRQGYAHRSCYLCPTSLIKTEKMVETHLGSGSHNRKLKRYVAELDRLSEEQKRPVENGGMTVDELVRRLYERLERQVAATGRDRQGKKIKPVLTPEDKLRIAKERKERIKTKLAARAERKAIRKANADPNKKKEKPERKTKKERKAAKKERKAAKAAAAGKQRWQSRGKQIDGRAKKVAKTATAPSEA